MGTGKTRVIASRITHLIKETGYEPDQIVSVTFTNKAAREMRERLGLFLSVEETDEIVMGESFLPNPPMSRSCAGQVMADFYPCGLQAPSMEFA